MNEELRMMNEELGCAVIVHCHAAKRACALNSHLSYKQSPLGHLLSRLLMIVRYEKSYSCLAGTISNRPPVRLVIVTLHD